MASKEQLLAWVRTQKEGVLEQLDAHEGTLKALASQIGQLQVAHSPSTPLTARFKWL